MILCKCGRPADFSHVCISEVVITTTTEPAFRMEFGPSRTYTTDGPIGLGYILVLQKPAKCGECKKPATAILLDDEHDNVPLCGDHLPKIEPDTSWR